jgi:starch synthase
LGSGQYNIEKTLESIQHEHPHHYRLCIAYNEPLSHQLYAGADFLLMPSRVEPCGLNQLYALRYGTIPMVRRTGGLQDTVLDFGDEGGFGICFNKASVGDILHGFQRALELYTDSERIETIRKKMMNINHSWEQSAQEYIELYQ